MVDFSSGFLFPVIISEHFLAPTPCVCPFFCDEGGIVCSPEISSARPFSPGILIVLSLLVQRKYQRKDTGSVAAGGWSAELTIPTWGRASPPCVGYCSNIQPYRLAPPAPHGVWRGVLRMAPSHELVMHQLCMFYAAGFIVALFSF